MSSRARAFWDEQARWNALVAILDGQEIRDPARATAAFEAEGESAARRLAPFVHPGSRVLDFGCGIGRVMRPLARQVREVIGVDVSNEMLERAEEYLRDVANRRLVLTDGRSLPGVADGSVDFLYSILVFIHVDRRSAFRTFGDIARVLAPDGRALLQFHDLESAPGLAKFEGVVDKDYPLEFYTERELELLLGRQGLSILETERSEEYFFLQVVRGPAELWIEHWRAGVKLRPRGASGLFRAARAARGGPAELAAELELTDDAWRGFQLALSLAPRGEGTARGARASATFFLRGPARHEITVRWADGKPTFLLDGRPLEVAVGGDFPPPGPAELLMALVPSGLRLDEELFGRFPSTTQARSVELTD